MMNLSQVVNYFRWELGGLPRGNLELLIIEHLDTQRELLKMPLEEFILLHLVVQGYTQSEITHQLGINPRTVARRVLKLHHQLLESE